MRLERPLEGQEIVDLDLVREAMWKATELDSDVAAFKDHWPEPPPTMTPFPTITWEELERQIVSLSSRPQAAAVAGLALRGWKTRAWHIPHEMLLREVLIVAWAAMDETFLEQAIGEPEPDGGSPMR